MTTLLKALQTYPAHIRGVLYHHRKKILMSVAVGGLIYYFTHKMKLKAAARALEFQQLSDIRMSTYFESAQRTCDATALSVISKLKENIETLLDVPSSAAIRTCESKEQKLLLWESLKNRTFARIFVGIYALVMMALHLRLQVNVVGRYLHLDTVLNGIASQEEPAFGRDTETCYLAHAEYLLHSGLSGVCATVERTVAEVLDSWPLTHMVSYDDLLRIVLGIRLHMEGQMDNLLSNLLPPETLDYQQTDPKLVMLLSETRNILESEAFRCVLKRCLDATFLCLTTNLRASFSPTLADTTTATDATQLLSSPSPSPLITIPMAKIIPIVNRQFAYVLNQEMDNDILQCIGNVPQLHDYSLELFKLS